LRTWTGCNWPSASKDLAMSPTASPSCGVQRPFSFSSTMISWGSMKKTSPRPTSPALILAATVSSFAWMALAGGTQYGSRCARTCKTDMLPGATKPVFSLCRESEMSLSFCTAVDDIRQAATEYRLPGSNKKLLWATILAQVAKSDMCDGSLADLLLDIIRDYLKRPSDEEIISMWLETETGSGDDPDELLADSVRLGLEMELLAEVTRVAWE